MRLVTASAVVLLLLSGCGSAASAAPDHDAAVEQEGAQTEDGGSAAGTDAESMTSAHAGHSADGKNAACRLLSAEEISAAVGVPVRTDGMSEDQGDMSECVWLNDDADLRQLHLQTYDHDVYAPDAWGGTPEPLDGIGDEAFVVSDSSLGVTAGYRQDERVVFLTYQAINSDRTPAELADEVVALLRTIWERDC